jgi:integrase
MRLGVGLADIHLHQTRHTFARMAGEDAGSLIEVQEALGHKAHRYHARVP